MESPAKAHEQLVAAVAPGSPDVASRVALAIEDPREYAARYADALRGRGISGTEIVEGAMDLPWLALIDALVDARRVAYVDWKEEPGDVMAALDRLATAPTLPRRWAWTARLDPSEMTTHAFLARAAKALRKEGLELAYLDEGSDGVSLDLLRRLPKGVPDLEACALRDVREELAQVLWLERMSEDASGDAGPTHAARAAGEPPASPVRVRHKSLGDGVIVRSLEGGKVEVRFGDRTTVLLRSSLETL